MQAFEDHFEPLIKANKLILDKTSLVETEDGNIVLIDDIQCSQDVLRSFECPSFSVHMTRGARIVLMHNLYVKNKATDQEMVHPTLTGILFIFIGVLFVILQREKYENMFYYLQTLQFFISQSK